MLTTVLPTLNGVDSQFLTTFQFAIYRSPAKGPARWRAHDRNRCSHGGASVWRTGPRAGPGHLAYGGGPRKPNPGNGRTASRTRAGDAADRHGGDVRRRGRGGAHWRGGRGSP